MSVGAFNLSFQNWEALGLGFRYSFIYHGSSTRRQRRDFFGLRVKLPPVITSLTTQK